MIKKILGYFLTWKILIFILVILLEPHIKDTVFYEAKNLFSDRYDQLIWRFANMDGIIYLRVAKNGYTSYELPFFPLYPLLIRFFSVNFLHSKYFTPTSQVISNISFFFALIVSWKLFELEKKRNLFTLFLILVLTFPTSFFYGASYNDSLFFLLAVTTIYLTKKSHILLAGIFGALATLTRLNGLVLFIFIVAEYFSKITKFEYFNQIPLSKKFLSRIKKIFLVKNVLKEKAYISLLIPLAFFSYLYFIQMRFGHWHLLFSTMKNWGQDRIIFPPQVFWRYFKILFIHPTFKLNYWIAGIELLSVLFYIFILTVSFKKIRISYWLLIFVSFLIPSMTGTFQGMPRYALHLYPFFLFLAEYINQTKPFVRIIYFSISIFLLIVLLSLYTSGYFVA